MLIYLDVCCFNRPFDNQDQLRIRQETAAIFSIHTLILTREVELCWSYMLDFENSQNPNQERRFAVDKWKRRAAVYCPASESIRIMGNTFSANGVPTKDSLHVACAVVTWCNHFITTDLKLLKKKCQGISIINPVDFIRIMEDRL